MKENRSCLYQYTYDLFIQSDTVFTLSSCVFGLSNPLIYALLNKIGCLMLILFSDLWYFDTNHLYTVPQCLYIWLRWFLYSQYLINPGTWSVCVILVTVSCVISFLFLPTFPISVWWVVFFCLGSYFWLLLVWLLLWNSSRFDNNLAPWLGYILTNA